MKRKLFSTILLFILFACSCGIPENGSNGSAAYGTETDNSQPFSSAENSPADKRSDATVISENSTPPAEEDFSEKDSAYIRHTQGAEQVSFSDEIQKMDGDTEKVDFYPIKKGDSVCGLTVLFCFQEGSPNEGEKIQTQIKFSGELELEGILYKESGSSDVFSDKLEEGWYIFFPYAHSLPEDFPLPPDAQTVYINDQQNHFSLLMDTEPFSIFDPTAEIPDSWFDECDYIGVTATLSEMQLRKNLNWFLCEYESAADIIKISRDTALEQ